MRMGRALMALLCLGLVMPRRCGVARAARGRVTNGRICFGSRGSERIREALIRSVGASYTTRTPAISPPFPHTFGEQYAGCERYAATYKALTESERSACPQGAFGL